MGQIYRLDEIQNLNFHLKTPMIIFLRGDLGAGKTTLTKHILQDLLSVKDTITSPTYVYYNKYNGGVKSEEGRVNNNLNCHPELARPEDSVDSGSLEEQTINNRFLPSQEGQRFVDKVSVYHFDLYRLKDYDEFFAIGGEDILDNNDGIVLIEWPEIIAEHYSPDIDVYLKKTDREDEREITLQYF